MTGHKQDNEYQHEDGLAVELDSVSRSYRSGRRTIEAVRPTTVHIERGEFVSIVGPSGCGKSTLLNMITGIDTPDRGAVTVLGQPLNGLGQDRLAAWRGQNVGIIFQFFQLMPTLTVRENVMLPMDLANRPGNHGERADLLLSRVGIAHLATHLPSELSGGEQQRVAIARALANNPPLLVADEPTGNLDSRTGAAVIDLIEQQWRDGVTVVLVTHDSQIAARASRTISMRDGRIESDEPTDRPTAVERQIIAASADAD